jgi:integrase
MALKKVGSGRYRVSVSVRPKGGKPITKTATVDGTLADAKMAEVDMYNELKARSLTSVFASTFGQAVKLYILNRKDRGLIGSKHETMVGHVCRWLGHIRMEVFADQFEVWRKHLMISPTAQGKLRGSASVNRYTAIVRAVFNHLVELELIPKNPITRARFPILQEQPRDRVLAPEERLRLLSAIDEHRPYIAPIVRFMLAVPCRSGELMELGREQYSPITNTIFIADSKSKVSIYKPVPPWMAEYFRTIPEGCPWLFYKEASGQYRPMTKTVLRKAWEHCRVKAGLEDYHTHDLRHEAVTDLYDAGNRELDIAAVCGWKPQGQAAALPMLPRYKHTAKLEAAMRIVFKTPDLEPQGAFLGAVKEG